MAEKIKIEIPGELPREVEALTGTGWRSVFGQARREEVEPIDAIITEELEGIDPDEWR